MIRRDRNSEEMKKHKLRERQMVRLLWLLLVLLILHDFGSNWRGYPKFT